MKKKERMKERKSVMTSFTDPEGKEPLHRKGRTAAACRDESVSLMPLMALGP